jgi:hypothetical protein
MDPLSLSMIIGAGASLVSGIAGSFASGAAADTQAKAASQALKFQQKAYNTARADAAPWLKAGKTALGQYLGELGLSKTGADGKPFVSQFTATPSYEFTRSEGQRGIESNMRSLGLGGSGAALKALSRYNEQLASGEYGNYLSRVAGVAGEGGTMATNSGNAAITSAANAGNAAMAGGAATASGYTGAANAITGALGNFANNAGAYLGNYDNSWNRIAA